MARPITLSQQYTISSTSSTTLWKSKACQGGENSVNHLDKKVLLSARTLPEMCGLDPLMLSGGAAGAEPLVSRLAEMFVGGAQPPDVQPHLMLKFGFSTLCLRVPLCASSFTQRQAQIVYCCAINVYNKCREP